MVGRADDLRLLRTFVDDTARSGGALLLYGDAGVGKTMLLDAAAAYADSVGTRVLRAAGTQFEATVSFAGLHQVLHPILDLLPSLPGASRRALGIGLGLYEGQSAAQLMIANAALVLLERAARTGPVLIVVDDLPWLDRASTAVLAFVARRLSTVRVGFLGASRSGEAGYFDGAGLPERELQPLDAAASDTLLRERYPALNIRMRQRLLDEARGNPLALLELPLAVADSPTGATGAPRGVLPLTRRLQSVFASRVDPLPPATRDLLLLAVLDGTGDLSALRGDEGGADTLKAFGPAERARLVRVDAGGGRLEFRHPLIRSAIVELSTSDERRAAHRLLATRRPDQPELRAWHLAEAAEGPDEEVAALMQSVAHANLRRGDAVGAISELLRAADLSPNGTDRGSRIAEAAYLGATVTGDLAALPGLLDAVRRADPDRAGSLAGAVAGSYYLLNGDGDVDSAHRLLIGAVDSLDDPTDAHHKALIEALYSLLMVAFFSGRPDMWPATDAAIDRLVPWPPELLRISSRTLADPARRAASAMADLDAAIERLSDENSPARIVRTATAGAYLDRLDGCRAALHRVVSQGRDGSATTSVIEALFLLANEGYLAGRWHEVEAWCDEGLALCDKYSYRLLAWPGIYLRAMLAAARGDEAVVRANTEAMLRWAVPRRVGLVRGYAAHVQALAAHARGDFDTAYRQASLVSPPGELSAYTPHALWLVLDLTEAAARSGRQAEAAAHARAARDAGLAQLSPRLAMLVSAATALADPDPGANEPFVAALEVPEADRWPFDLARIQLAYGERLRRTKATIEARMHLTAALEIFQRLSAHPWAARAGTELRATGLAVTRTRDVAAEALTPQQREIASLAAAGLSNKQIGERLFLSPRTVSTHLYRIFPKLGITSRAALRDALEQLPGE
ncbi:helix-turn-helix transcriptional regulator [Dactylosporangium sp. CA-139066]|uniref:helix-turn-helix transcriptional regulator n=1 Tax=Dactylosporangium sp. CA-139066 TaxID=3239930 RepID=UPI003D8D17D2